MILLAAQVFFLCRRCQQPFLAIYTRNSFGDLSILISCEPMQFQKKTFEKRISDLSTNYTTAYNEALEAESSGLKEICGMGYRKALEYLVTAYLLKIYPSQHDEILKMPLSQRINEKVTNDNLRLTASRCAWLGNDWSHYERKHTDKDLKDLKELLEATEHWINMELITAAASNIPKK